MKSGEVYVDLSGFTWLSEFVEEYKNSDWKREEELEIKLAKALIPLFPQDVLLYYDCKLLVPVPDVMHAPMPE